MSEARMAELSPIPLSTLGNNPMFTAVCFVVAVYVAYRGGFSVGYVFGYDDGINDGRKR